MALQMLACKEVGQETFVPVSDRVYDPKSFPKDKKQAYAMEGRVFKCNCTRDFDLYYRFRKGADNGLYPMHKWMVSKHAPMCDLYRPLTEYESTGAIQENEKGELVVKVRDNLLNPPTWDGKKRSSGNNHYNDRAEKNTPETWFSRLLIVLNSKTSYRQARRIARQGGTPMKNDIEFAAEYYRVAETTHIDGDPYGTDTLISDKMKEAGIRFYYARMVFLSVGKTKEDAKELTVITKDFIDRYACDRNNREFCFIGYKHKDRIGRIKATRYCVASMFKRFFEKKQFTEIDLFTHTVYFAALAYPDDKNWPVVRRLGFVLSAKSGVFCDSFYEEEAYNAIWELCNKRKDMCYYKPEGELHSIAYPDTDMREDGVIFIYGVTKPIVFELFGRMNDPKYAHEARRKIEKAREYAADYAYIYWDPGAEKLEDFIKRLSDTADKVIAEGR